MDRKRLVALFVLATGFSLAAAERMEAQTPTPPWQADPTSAEFHSWSAQPEPAGESSPAGPAGPQGDACGPGEACGSCDESSDLVSAVFGPCFGLTLPHDDWVRAEALLWWTKGAKMPPLLTTSPNGTPQAQAGVLGQPGTTVLFGNQELNHDLRAGGRISFGTWLDAADSFGVEFAYMALGRSGEQFSMTSTGSPILARPFFNVGPPSQEFPNAGMEDAHLVAFPNVVQGTFSASSTASFQGAEVLARWAVARSPGSRIELLGGYRFQQLIEGLDLSETASTPGGASAQVFDEFHARNNFNGVEIGLAIEQHQYRWSLETSLKLALGNNNSQIAINGATTTGGNTLTGGFLALPSNIGVYNSNQFAVIPELGVTLGYDLTCHLRAMFGYTFLYWSNVSRPGDQIDLNLSPAQFPPPTGASTRPAFVQHTSDYWAQGLNIGLDYRF